MNSLIERLQANQLDLVRVKRCFLEHWHTVYTIGEVNYLSLFDHDLPVHGSSELLAFMLLGASRVFTDSIEGTPNSAMECWNAVQFMIEDLLPEGTKFSKPGIYIKYEGEKE